MSSFNITRNLAARWTQETFTSGAPLTDAEARIVGSELVHKLIKEKGYSVIHDTSSHAAFYDSISEVAAKLADETRIRSALTKTVKEWVQAEYIDSYHASKRELDFVAGWIINQGECKTKADFEDMIEAGVASELLHDASEQFENQNELAALA